MYVIDGISHGLQILQILVFDAEPNGTFRQLLLERFDELDEREGIGIEVIGDEVVARRFRAYTDLD